MSALPAPASLASPASPAPHAAPASHAQSSTTSQNVANCDNGKDGDDADDPAWEPEAQSAAKKTKRSPRGSPSPRPPSPAAVTAALHLEHGRSFGCVPEETLDEAHRLEEAQREKLGDRPFAEAVVQLVGSSAGDISKNSQFDCKLKPYDAPPFTLLSGLTSHRKGPRPLRIVAQGVSRSSSPGSGGPAAIGALRRALWRALKSPVLVEASDRINDFKTPARVKVVVGGVRMAARLPAGACVAVLVEDEDGVDHLATEDVNGVSHIRVMHLGEKTSLDELLAHADIDKYELMRVRLVVFEADDVAEPLWDVSLGHVVAKKPSGFWDGRSDVSKANLVVERAAPMPKRKAAAGADAARGKQARLEKLRDRIETAQDGCLLDVSRAGLQQAEGDWSGEFLCDA